MKLSNVTKEQIEEAARNTGGVRLDNFKPLNQKATRFNVKLSPSETGKARRWGSVNPMSGRKTHAVNWYGFRRFFRELYKINPSAKIETTFGIYTSSEDFEERHGETEYKNVGSQMYPYTMKDCADSDIDGNPL